MGQGRGARRGAPDSGAGAEGFPTGPDVGEPAPDFSLVDQLGRAVTLSGVLRRSRALVVFHRSARW